MYNNNSSIFNTMILSGINEPTIVLRRSLFADTFHRRSPFLSPPGRSTPSSAPADAADPPARPRVSHARRRRLNFNKPIRCQRLAHFVTRAKDSKCDLARLFRVGARRPPISRDRQLPCRRALVGGRAGVRCTTVVATPPKARDPKVSLQ